MTRKEKLKQKRREEIKKSPVYKMFLDQLRLQLLGDPDSEWKEKALKENAPAVTEASK